MRYFVIGFIFLAHLASAQRSDQEYLLDYKAAVQLYAEEDFKGVLQKLTPLSSPSYDNAVVPYVLYYFSLASLKENKAYQARASLRDLFTRYPDWSKIDEVYYLYAYANFKDKYYEEGLSFLNRINAKELEEDVQGLLETDIPKIENILLLKELNQKFPNERVIAETLVKRIQSRKYNTKTDLELSDKLTDLFEILPEEGSRSTNGQVNYERSYDDKTIDIGVLLPFELEDINIKDATGENRFVYDMYMGMKMATEKLAKEKIPVKLYGFDVIKTPESLQKYLNDKNFKMIDLFFGPLYGRPNKLAEEFADKNKIFQVHPISNSRSLIVDSDSRFLVQASNETQAEECLNYVESLGRQKTVSIYHDGSRKDSILAHIYGITAKKRGYKIIEEKRFDDQSSIINKKNVGHVFMTGDSKFGPKMIRALSQNKLDSTVIATDACFNMESVSRSLLSKNLYIIYPQFINPEKSSVHDFNMAYIERMKMIPSYYAYLGYDMMLFYARMLKDGKEIFRLNLNESPQMDDLLLSGFNYSNKSFENKLVPIVKYNHGRFELVNIND